MNFKRVLAGLFLILSIANVTCCPSICCAVETKVSVADYSREKDTIVKVCVEYRKMLEMDLLYDSDSLIEYTGRDLVASFKSDCEYLEKNKKGVCRHFANYLIFKLRGVGVEAYPLYIHGENGYRHQAVLYKAGERFFVADITGDIKAINRGDRSRISDPWFFMDDLETFIEEMKGFCNAEIIDYLDADLTDKDTHIDSEEKVIERMKVLFKKKRDEWRCLVM